MLVQTSYKQGLRTVSVKKPNMPGSVHTSYKDGAVSERDFRGRVLASCRHEGFTWVVSLRVMGVNTQNAYLL